MDVVTLAGKPPVRLGEMSGGVKMCGSRNCERRCGEVNESKKD